MFYLKIAFNIVAIVCLVTMAATATAESSAGEGTVAIIAPKVLQPNRPYSVAISCHSPSAPSKLSVSLKGPSYADTKVTDFKASESKIIVFDVPDIPSGAYNLTVESVEGEVDLKKTGQLVFVPEEPIIKIYTSKALYKPGEVVKFWVLFLDENLRPSQPWANASIQIKRGNALILNEYDNLVVRNGVYANEFQIADTAAAIESYQISVQNSGHAEDYYKQKLPFKILEYEGPLHDITIEGPRKFSVREESVPFTVKAQYKHTENHAVPVQGKVRFTIGNMHTHTGEHPVDYESTAELIEGKAKFQVDLRSIASTLPTYLTHYLIEVSAFVVEHETGHESGQRLFAHLFPNRYEIKKLSDSFYVPEEEMEVLIQVLNVDGSQVQASEGATVELHSKQTTWEVGSFNSKESHPRPELDSTIYKFEGPLNELGQAKVKVTLPQLPVSPGWVRCFHTVARFHDEEAFVGNLIPQRDPIEEENSGVRFWKGPDMTADVLYAKDTKSFEVGQQATFAIKSKDTFSFLIYTVIGRNRVLEHKRIDFDKPKDVYNLTLTTTKEMSPKGKILVFYVDEVGKILHTEKSFDVEIELENPITISAPDQVQPGDEVPLQVQTSANALVGIKAVDQSLMHSRDSESVNDLKSMASWSVQNPLLMLSNANHEPLTWEQFNGHSSSGPGWDNSHHTNLIQNIDTVAGDESSRDDVLKVRRNLADSWIFDLLESGESGFIEWSKRIPDSIARWTIQAFSLHADKGLGITKQISNVNAFQPFFLSLQVPAAVKRGDIVNITALVFNYLKEDLDVTVTLDNTEGEYDFIELSANDIEPSEKLTKALKVPINNAKGASFVLRPRTVGNILLKFQALSEVAGDTVHKVLKVSPEGVAKLQQCNKIMQLNDKLQELTETIELNAPAGDIVPDSVILVLSLTTDPVGAWLHHMVQGTFSDWRRHGNDCTQHIVGAILLPTALLKYLKATNRLLPPLEQKYQNELSTGYKALRNFHSPKDGSFFKDFRYQGYSEKDSIEEAGSTSATAYVLYNLAHAKDYLNINEDDVITKGLEFLLTQQTPHGNFQENGQIVYEEMANPVALTANVLMAFVEHKDLWRDDYQRAVNRALKFLYEHKDNVKDRLTRHLVKHVIGRAIEQGVDVSVHNLARCQRHRQQPWWAEKAEGSDDTDDTFAKGCSIFRALNQDETALLSILAALERNPFLPTVEVKYTGEVAGTGQASISKTLQLNGTRSSFTLFDKLPNNVREIRLHASGNGLLTISGTLRYNIYAEAEGEQKKNFIVTVTMEKKLQSAGETVSVHGGQYRLNLHVTYVGDREDSDLVILSMYLSYDNRIASVQALNDLLNMPDVMQAFVTGAGSRLDIRYRNMHRNEEIVFPVAVDLSQPRESVENKPYAHITVLEAGNRVTECTFRCALDLPTELKAEGEEQTAGSISGSAQEDDLPKEGNQLKCTSLK